MTNLKTSLNLVKRENFVSLAFLDQVRNKSGYKDTRIPIGFDQNATKPSIIKMMLEHLVEGLNNFDSVLEIGTGSGYQTAILAHMFKKVYTIEFFKPLQEQAKKNLTEYKNIEFIVGDGKEGVKGKTFDGIIACCCFPEIPKDLKNQCKGNLIIPVGNEKAQTLYKNETPLKNVGFVLAQ